MANGTGFLPASLASDTRFAAFDSLLRNFVQVQDTTPALVYLVDMVAADALPALAAQFHVLGAEGWNAATTDAARRELIKSAIELHRYKGTPWAVRQAIATLGVTATIDERVADWSMFDVRLALTDGLSALQWEAVARLVDAYKPASRALRSLIVTFVSRGAFNAACVSFAGDIVTVQPYQLTDITAPSMQPKAGIGRHDWGTTTIYPRTL